MLEFDARTARFLENAYRGSDFARRRRMSFDALRLKPGDRIADIGCGNGILTADIARAVGATGRVHGIDPSADMRETAAERCNDFVTVEIVSGSATDLPLAPASCTKAVSVQVFEYLDDIPAALREIFRILVPGGRVVIGDMHFDTLIWYSENRARMTSMQAAWDSHLVDRCVPEHLPGDLEEAGFALEAVVPLTCTDTVLRPDGLANTMLHLMQNYALQYELLPAEDVKGWVEEQQGLAEKGRFFFSLTHFVVAARKL